MTDSMDAARKIEVAGWSAFFLWLGASMLLDLGWGIGMFGIGLITIGVQWARKRSGLPVERFWVIAGVFFILCGLGSRFGVDLPLLPVALMLLGGALLVSLFRHKETPHLPGAAK